MAQTPDLGPSSSYSDPIYDRLDTFSQQLKRRWPLYALALIVVILIAVVVHVLLQRSPAASSAQAFLAARDERDPAKRISAYQAIVVDATATPEFRAHAAVEVVQDHLNHNQTAEAMTVAKQAVEFAKQASSQSNASDLPFVAQLSLAAAQEQSGDLAAAEAVFAQVERAAGTKNRVYQLTATLGSARVLEAQGKLDDALAKLEPVLNSAEKGGAESLGELAKVQYWNLKRHQVTPATAAVVPVVAATKPAVEPGAAPTPTPTPASEPAPAAPTPAASAPR